MSRKKKPMDSVKIVGGHGDRRERDFYPTPPDCTEALLNYLGVRPKPLGKAWECADGDGHISRVLRRYGYEVIESDIQTGTDFLTADLPHGAEWIITNPPFNLAEAFIRKALSFNVPVALLLKSQFWHSKKRYPLFMQAPPFLVLPLTWRPDFTGQGASLLDMMWCVWDQEYADGDTHYRPLERP